MAEIEKKVRAAFSGTTEPVDDGFAHAVSAKVPRHDRRRRLLAIVLAAVAVLSFLALCLAVGIAASILPRMFGEVCRVWL